jgi:hypothetical protein
MQSCVGYTKHKRHLMDFRSKCDKLTNKGGFCKDPPLYETLDGTWCCKNHIKQYVHICDCPICLTTCNLSNSVITGCNHRFHLNCIRMWLITNMNNTCPVCRSSFKICQLGTNTEYIDIRYIGDDDVTTKKDINLSVLYIQMQRDLSPTQIEHVFDAFTKNRLIYFPISLYEYNTKNWYATT